MQQKGSVTSKQKDYLQQEWLNLLSNFQVEAHLTQELWEELQNYYSEKHRAYHNPHHLYDIFIKLEKQKEQINDLPAIQFAIWYHDIIYQPLSKQNEEKSAMLCAKRLDEMGFESSFKEKVFKLICSTKRHDLEAWESKADQTDNAILLDLDLSILGTDQKSYQSYIQQIRQEYKIVPTFLYQRGRKKVLRHFLEQDRIFKTALFFEQYEQVARENIAMELEG